jgi:hypothetical protein
MPFCPACRAEYVEGVKECKDCGTALVGALAPEVHEDKEALVQVYGPDTEAEAGMIISLLQGEGIQAELYPSWEKKAAMWWKLFSDAGGNWGAVVVLEHEAERARELIKNFLQAQPEVPPETEGGKEEP